MYTSVSTSAIITRLGIDGAFAAIKEAGFDGLDFGFDHVFTWEDVTNPEANARSFFSDDAEIARYTDLIKTTAEKYDLKFVQFHAPYTLYIPNDTFVSENMKTACRKSIEICGACGCDKIVIHPCFCEFTPESPDPEEEWKLNIDFYSSFIPTLKACGVKCCLENVFVTGKKGKNYGAIYSDAPEACRYIDALNEIAGETLFGFCLDTGHLLIASHDIAFAIRTLGERLIALHIHDNDGDHDDHNAPYIGGVQDWERFLLGLRAIGYKGNMDMETRNAVARVPDALIPSALRLLADTANYFRDMVLNNIE
jgi:sugar phosphate isomerase/epimerase